MIEKKQITHRLRRGKLVEIPEQWRDKHVYRRTYRSREEMRKLKKLKDIRVIDKPKNSKDEVFIKEQLDDE